LHQGELALGERAAPPYRRAGRGVQPETELAEATREQVRRLKSAQAYHRVVGLLDQRDAPHLTPRLEREGREALRERGEGGGEEVQREVGRCREPADRRPERL